jgi:hypothetical protein
MISIITCDRPYLYDTINAVDAQVDDEIDRILICDNKCAPIVPSAWKQIPVPPRCMGARIDNKFAGWEAIKAAANARQDLLFLEDDIKPVSDNSFAQMLSHQVPAWAAFTSFFHPFHPVGKMLGFKFEMSQAILFPLRTLLLFKDAPARSPGEWEGMTGVDSLISIFCRIYGLDYELHPNLIYHVGHISAANPDRPPDSPYSPKIIS